MNKKLKVTIKVIDNVACKIFRKYLIIKYPDTDYLLKFTMKRIWKRTFNSWRSNFEFFEPTDVLLFHALAILL